MRLKEKEKEIIKATLLDIFGISKIYLFGSRVDDSKKGGDIDLYIIIEKKNNLYEKKITALSKLERLLYKPVDLVIHKDFSRDIEKEALNGILL